MEFQAWPKTARLYRPVIVTEKIDGTNAAVIIEESGLCVKAPEAVAIVEGPDGLPYNIGAQSRKRLITPDADNFGFARWVFDNAETLVRDLGPGRHFGEWWGSGIQRGYGLPRGDKRFSLFNVTKWWVPSREFQTRELRVVPILFQGLFSDAAVKLALQTLAEEGSLAALEEGVYFDNPEGVCTFHVASNTVFKTTFDDQAKGE